MSVLRTDERNILASISESEAALELLTELLRFVEAGFPQKLDDVRILEGKLSGCRQILSGISHEIVEALPSEDLEQTVVDRSQILSKQRVTAEALLKTAKENYARFAALRDANARLSQEMRSIASRLIEQTETIDVCPLCHTRFPPGELMQHMQQGLDHVVESEAKKLLGQIQNCESQLAEIVKRDDAAKWLMDYCERIKQAQSSKLQSIIASLSQARSECNSAFARLSAIRGELTSAASEGLSVERYQQLLDRLVGELDAESAITGEAIRLRMERYSQIITNAKQNLGAVTTELITLQQSGEREFETLRIPQKSLASALSELKEQLAAGASMYDKLQVLLKSLLWPPGSPLSDLLVTIQSIREVAADFQSTFAKEQTASIVIAESTKKKVQLETQLAGLIPRIDRFSEAFDVLTRIQEQHSLAQGVETALRQNRIAIESIFSQIHAPAEFSGLGDSLTTLVRKGGGALANLQQISTGQRAAFALSLFLAQNAQLKTAPPVILIDDPIAHVDDLNCLSFLDYLRELAVSGGRQIIFATANDKLATLFERKFDFLGAEDFRRYDLKR
jgi:DNA repair exonuclease SbcCD ATPase subunit